jgi:hypothetical protein
MIPLHGFPPFFLSIPKKYEKPFPSTRKFAFEQKPKFSPKCTTHLLGKMGKYRGFKGRNGLLEQFSYNT